MRPDDGSWIYNSPAVLWVWWGGGSKQLRLGECGSRAERVGRCGNFDRAFEGGGEISGWPWDYGDG